MIKIMYLIISRNKMHVFRNFFRYVVHYIQTLLSIYALTLTIFLLNILLTEMPNLRKLSHAKLCVYFLSACISFIFSFSVQMPGKSEGETEHATDEKNDGVFSMCMHHFHLQFYRPFSIK